MPAAAIRARTHPAEFARIANLGFQFVQLGMLLIKRLSARFAYTRKWVPFSCLGAATVPLRGSQNTNPLSHSYRRMRG
jgi:hypothetical protein